MPEQEVILCVTSLGDTEATASSPMPLSAGQELIELFDNLSTAGGVVPLPVPNNPYPINIAAHHATAWWLRDARAHG